MRRNPEPTLTDILRIGRETALGLAAAHELGLVHRDIKPANIWLEEPKQRIKILDFGLARRAEGGENLTQGGVLLGTPAYMSPEQADGLKVDARADLFSLGCVLYRLSTGQLPFAGTSVLSILKKLATHTPPPVSQLRSELPRPLAVLVARLLAKEIADRPASAQVVIAEIEAIERHVSNPAFASKVIPQAPLGGTHPDPVRPQLRRTSALRPPPSMVG